MTFARWTGSTWQTFTNYRRWTGSAWQPIANASRWNGSAWVQFGFLQASTSPSIVNGSSVTAGPVMTNATTVTVTGGTGSYTYAWNVVTSTGNTIAATSPTLATTTFFATVNNTHPSSLGTATCSVTDTVSGLVVTTNTVSIDIEYTGP